VTKFRVPRWGGSPRKKASKRGTPLKRRYFAAIGSYSVNTVADRYRLAAYRKKHWWRASITLNDLEFTKKGFQWIFRNFWMQRTFWHWIATKRLEIDRDNLRMKFLALNVDFSSPSTSRFPRFKESGAGERQSGYFTAIGSCSVKTVADRQRHAAYHNKHWWQAFYWCQRRWPWFTLNFQNRSFSVFSNVWLRRSFKEWIETKGIEIDQDNLRIGTAKAVARLMSFAQITCFNFKAIFTIVDVLQWKKESSEQLKAEALHPWYVLWMLTSKLLLPNWMWNKTAEM